MENEPEKKSPTKTFKGVAFLIACIGVSFLVGSADAFRLHGSPALGWLLSFLGLLFLVSGILLAARRP